jgi:hypothetical protein
VAAPARVRALVAAGGVDGPGEDLSEFREAAGLVREHGIGVVLGEEAMPAWAVRQVVEEMDSEVVARELECFAGLMLWPLLSKIQASTLRLVAGELESEHLAVAADGLRDGRTAVISNSAI